MSDQDGDDDQVAQWRDALLRRLLTMPPKSHAELAEELRRARARSLLGVAGGPPAQESAEVLLRRSGLG